MKRINIIMRIVIILFVIVATSCIDHYQIRTTVLKDGSLIRTISVTGDSTSLFQGRIKMPNDSSWQTKLSWEYEHAADTTSKKRYTYTATKHFENFDLLNDFLNTESDSSRFAIITINLERKFRWFYTYFSYTEQYKKEFPFNYYPIDSFLTDEQMGFLYDDEFIYSREHDSLIHIKDLTQMPALGPSDSIRMEEIEAELLYGMANWQARNIIEEFLELLSAINPYINLSTSEKEELFQDRDFVEGFLIKFNDDEDPLESIIERFGIREETITQLLPEQSKLFYDNLELCYGYFDSEEILNQIELPGILLNCNADSISTNIAYWNYSENRYFTKDFTLSAESRILNQWAFIISGVLVLVLLSLLVIGFVRK